MLRMIAVMAGALLLTGVAAESGAADGAGSQPFQPGPQMAQRNGGIEIYEADYGERGRYCSAERRIARECSGRRDCEIEVDNRLCGDPMPGEVKELRLTFGCEGRRGSDEDRVRAREGQRVRLECDRGRAQAQVFGRPGPSDDNGSRARGGRDSGRDIEILGARYGSGRQTCNAGPAVAEQCNGRDRCRIRADNSLCGDPAYGERKTLEITYACGRGQRNASGFEGARIELHC